MRTSPRPEEAPCPRGEVFTCHVSRVTCSDNGYACHGGHITLSRWHMVTSDTFHSGAVCRGRKHIIVIFSEGYWVKPPSCARGPVARRVSPRVPCYGCVSILMCGCRGPGPTWTRRHASSRQSPGAAAVTILSRVLLSLFLHQYHWWIHNFWKRCLSGSTNSDRQHNFNIETGRLAKNSFSLLLGKCLRFADRQYNFNIVTTIAD